MPLGEIHIKAAQKIIDTQRREWFGINVGINDAYCVKDLDTIQVLISISDERYREGAFNFFYSWKKLIETYVLCGLNVYVGCAVFDREIIFNFMRDWYNEKNKINVATSLIIS